ncbi:M15 family metallopeptidase [Chlamydiales bacterium]|nr:M15 family metallopeptidase [Chlamydiales bacterium]
MKLVEIQEVEPHLILDIVYATADNFMGERLYSSPHCFLDEEVARALNNALHLLNKYSLGLKVWDGYRPTPIQQKMWDKIQDERYVSNPQKEGGRHTRGTAVDLTLITLKGEELPMPTPFDSFESAAHSDYISLSPEVLKNRALLKHVMESVGFKQLPTEWWHFDYEGWRDNKRFPPYDISFKQLINTQ